MEELKDRNRMAGTAGISSSGEQSELSVDKPVHTALGNNITIDKPTARERWIYRIKKAASPLKKNLRQYISPSFIVMLFLAFTIWYVVKLGDSYVTNIPIQVDIEGYQIKVECMVKGQGYSLLSNKFRRNRTISLNWSDLEITPSVLNPDHYVISPYSLQNAISARKTNLQVISIGTIPEIVR